MAVREDDLDPRQVERMPVDDRRAGDEGAVVERVGELGERAEAARQARIDDLDGDPQRRDRSADLLARIGSRRPRRQVARELEGEFALELGRDEAGRAQGRAVRLARRASTARAAGRRSAPARRATRAGPASPPRPSSRRSRRVRSPPRPAAGRPRPGRSGCGRAGQAVIARASRRALASSARARSKSMSFIRPLSPSSAGVADAIGAPPG